MKQIVFRPLRRVKKSGKIVVASYMQWRKIKTADYSEFVLIVDDEYKSLPQDEYVYDHKGRNLFWRDYDPDSIPFHFGEQTASVTRTDHWRTEHIFFAKGLDVDGVPTFSHGNSKEIASGNNDLYIEDNWQPLTVAMVTKWFGWFLYQLENSRLKIGK